MRSPMPGMRCARRALSRRRRPSSRRARRPSSRARAGSPPSARRAPADRSAISPGSSENLIGMPRCSQPRRSSTTMSRWRVCGSSSPSRSVLTGANAMSLPAIQSTHSAWVLAQKGLASGNRARGPGPGPAAACTSGIRSGRPSAVSRLVANFVSAPPSATNLPSAGLVDPVHGVAAPGALVLGHGLAPLRHRQPVAVRQRGDQRIHHRDVDVVALAGGLAAQQRHQHAGRAPCCSPACRRRRSRAPTAGRPSRD